MTTVPGTIPATPIGGTDPLAGLTSVSLSVATVNSTAIGIDFAPVTAPVVGVGSAPGGTNGSATIHGCAVLPTVIPVITITHCGVIPAPIDGNLTLGSI